jgi:hypothetical protein
MSGEDHPIGEAIGTHRPRRTKNDCTLCSMGASAAVLLFGIGTALGAPLRFSGRLLDAVQPAVVVQSSSAAGKSSLMDAVLAFMPEEERIKYSAMTGQSLFYMGATNLQHKILAIVEEEDAHRASYALKLLQSEGELTIASTGKDPQTGNLVTQEYHVEGPVMIMLTTTAIEIDEELLNRCPVLSVDESREQIKRAPGEGGEPLEYIEANWQDIAHANAIAHEVLGRSLDELPPQMRRVLARVVTMVNEQCAAQQLSRAEHRSSRREVREYTGLSDTQLRLHLDRLVTLKYLLVHRGMRGQSFVYELLFDGPADSEAAHLSGLIDTPMTASSRGQRRMIAAPTRGVSNSATSSTGAKNDRSRGPAVTRALLERYRQHVFHYRRKDMGTPLSFQTQQKRLISVRMFFQWMTRQYHLRFNPASELELPRAEQRLPRHVLNIDG